MGCATIAYGFVSLRRGLSAYHWWLVVCFAWFAAITNLAALSCLSNYFRRHTGKRGWRLCLTTGMVTVLCFCMLPTARMREAMSTYDEERLEILAANALCFFPGRGGKPWPSSGISEFALRYSILFGYLAIWIAVAITVRVLERPHSILIRWCDVYALQVREILRHDQPICAHCEQRYCLLVIRPFVSCWLVLRTYIDLTNSVLFEVCLPL
jgi:hypothetical protein